jgi:aconitase A
MDRHVIANMGAELGATTTVFPSDLEVRRFLRAWQRDVSKTPCAAHAKHFTPEVKIMHPYNSLIHRLTPKTREPHKQLHNFFVKVV